MPSSDVALYAPALAPEGTPATRIEERPVDVLILTALQDELEAVLALGDNGRAGWHERKDEKGFRLYRGAFPNGREATLTIAAAWIGKMGERAAALRAQQLVEELAPACLAMCGICAGDRRKVALGDVIVADQLYSYDHGKVVAEEGNAPLVWHSLRTFDLEATWGMDAAFLARELNLTHLSQARPRSRAAQRRWLLSTLLAHEDAGGVAPGSHADRKSKCPDWTALAPEIQELAEGRIALLFDGFDELALRLTYDRALEHFETVVAAAKGNAKVVVTSRTQHFLTDLQVRLALATKAEQVPGYRLSCERRRSRAGRSPLPGCTRS